MYSYHLLEDRDVLCIDQKSFFASVSCIGKGLDPLETELAVVTDTKRQGSIILAATPKLEELGTKTGSRLPEMPHRSNIYIINPSMRKYLNVPVAISKTTLCYTSPEDLHQCSIDGFFVDITDSYHRFSSAIHAFYEGLKHEICEGTSIYCTVGIGSNMLLSKIAMDVEAKRSQNGIAEWRYQDIPTKLWPIQPLWDFWGINRRTEAKLNKRGISTIGDLAKYPYKFLKKEFGILGVDMHLHASRIGQSKVREKHKISNPSICRSQILMRDYHFDETEVVMRELIEDVANRVRAREKVARTIHFTFGYNDESGVRKQYTLRDPTNLGKDIYKIVMHFADKLYSKQTLYYTLSISLNQLINGGERQLSLFEDEYQRKRDGCLTKTIDQLHLKYGKGIVSKTVSFTEAGTRHGRLGLMAGHEM